MPSYLLVSFNDRGLNYWDNFKIMSETRNVNQFMEDIFALKFDGGDDPKERLMQASGLENTQTKLNFQRLLLLAGPPRRHQQVSGEVSDLRVHGQRLQGPRAEQGYTEEEARQAAHGMGPSIKFE